MLPKRLLRLIAAAVIAAAGAGVGSGPAGAADDPMRGLQWALDTIGVEPAAFGATGGGITVAVIDSGVDAGHEDLAGALVGTTDCIGTAGDPNRCRAGGGDTDGHGTHVAGIVAARAGNGKGIEGVAPGASVLSIKVLERGCENPGIGGLVCTATGDSADVEAGMRWAIARGARVLNLSVSDDAVGRATLGSPLATAIADAWQQGVIVVVAAGNDLDVAGRSGYENVPALVVAATGPDDDKPAYSNSVGTARWGMAAPGGDDEGACPSAAVLSTWLRASPPNTDYACLDGTSMAAPHVAGAAALLLSRGLTAAQTVDQLLTTARDIGAPGHDAVFGAGRLDVRRALATAAPSRGAGTPGAGTSAASTSPGRGTAAGPATSGSTVTAAPTPVTGTPPTAAPAPPAMPTTGLGARDGDMGDAVSDAAPRAGPGDAAVPGLLEFLAVAAVGANVVGLLAVDRRRRRPG